jgi:polyhydroxyalkanoate synthase subunit PhaC
VIPWLRNKKVRRNYSPSSSSLGGGPDAADGAQNLPAPASRSTPVHVSDSRSDRDSYAVTALADITDRALHATLGRLTGGISPAAMLEAYLDWATHLSFAPGKCGQLMSKAICKAVRLAAYAARPRSQDGAAEPCIDPFPQDRRFISEGWRKWPFDSGGTTTAAIRISFAR